jgi:hypothetical protein
VASVRAPLPVPSEADEARFALTTCYAAGQCQNDMCCPVREGCLRLREPVREDDDGYDE